MIEQKGIFVKNLTEKKKALEELFEQYTKKNIVIAFSGGVDSSLLLKVACEKAKQHHTTVYAYTIHTMLHPMEELELTERLAEEMGAVHRVLRVNELKEAGIEDNPVNRCYLCKKCMFTKLVKEAEQLQITTIIDGTNLDDTKVYRPGIAALKELGIISPLLLAEFTKPDVRALAKEYGISVSDRPSTPCMATRFPYHTRLTEEGMEQVQKMERMLKGFGFYNVRARVHDALVRIEVDAEDIEKLLEVRTEIISQIKSLGFDYVTVDLEGFRSGSQDLHLHMS